MRLEATDELEQRKSSPIVGCTDEQGQNQKSQFKLSETRISRIKSPEQKVTIQPRENYLAAILTSCLQASLARWPYYSEPCMRFEPTVSIGAVLRLPA